MCGHRAVLGHGGREPGFDGQLGQHASRRDALGEVVVGAEVVIVEAVPRASTAPPRVDALDGPALDDDGQRRDRRLPAADVACSSTAPS
jgi:hypothetical protein